MKHIRLADVTHHGGRDRIATRPDKWNANDFDTVDGVGAAQCSIRVRKASIKGNDSDTMTRPHLRSSKVMHSKFKPPGLRQILPHHVSYLHQCTLNPLYAYSKYKLSIMRY